jgi:hypothetical protein
VKRIDKRISVIGCFEPESFAAVSA